MRKPFFSSTYAIDLGCNNGLCGFFMTDPRRFQLDSSHLSSLEWSSKAFDNHPALLGSTIATSELNSSPCYFWWLEDGSWYCSMQHLKKRI